MSVRDRHQRGRKSQTGSHRLISPAPMIHKIMFFVASRKFTLFCVLCLIFYRSLHEQSMKASGSPQQPPREFKFSNFSFLLYFPASLRARRRTLTLKAWALHSPQNRWKIECKQARTLKLKTGLLRFMDFESLAAFFMLRRAATCGL